MGTGAVPDELRDLLDPTIVGDMRVLVVSEGFGLQLFGVAERHARGASDRQMWEALHELERQTRAAVFDALGDQVDAFLPRDRLARAAGVAGGSGLAVLPHRLQMHALVEGTRPFMPHFTRLWEHFTGTTRAAFFEYVLAHERAIAEVGRRALAHDDTALAPVETLLGAVPLVGTGELPAPVTGCP